MAAAPPPVEVDELERIEAPDVETFERRFVRASRPVVLTGVTEGWVPPREWTFARVAERYGDAQVIAAVLENGTLGRDTVDYRREPLR